MKNLHKFDRMGEHLAHPPFPTMHTAVNYLLTTPKRAFLPTAVIVTEKDVPDVSIYQLEIDYDVMSSKTDTLFIRAGQNLWRDPQFENNYTRSKEKGMLRGIYDFYDDRASPSKQADRICAQLVDSPEMEVYIDWETNYGGSFGGLKNVVALMQEIERRLPQITCGLYTGYYFFRANSNPVTHASQYAYLKTRSLWLAWYTSKPEEVLIPAPWTKLTWWQYGTPVENYGQKSKEIDKDYFNGTIREFYERYKSVPPAPGGTMFFKVVSVSSNIRSSAGVTLPDNDLGTDNLITNDIVETDDIPVIVSGITWRRLRRWWRANLERPLPASPTGERWGAEKGSAIWFISTIFTPPPAPSSDYLLHYSADGTLLKKYVPE